MLIALFQTAAQNSNIDIFFKENMSWQPLFLTLFLSLFRSRHRRKYPSTFFGPKNLSYFLDDNCTERTLLNFSKNGFMCTDSKNVIDSGSFAFWLRAWWIERDMEFAFWPLLLKRVKTVSLISQYLLGLGFKLITQQTPIITKLFIIRLIISS